jgi:chemotaxis protein methyltransferase CheR
MDDYQSYLRYVMNDPKGQEIAELLDAISTNVTGFFREPAHFDFLAWAVPEWLAKGQTRFRFWSAACATGQEPYSMAITLLEALRGQSLDARILATDISTRALAQARRATYDGGEMEAVPADLRQRYFDPIRNQAGTRYRAKDVVRQWVVFHRLNLSSPPFPMRGPFDAIFCRNVMIYFDHKTRANLLAEIRRLLRPGGYLMVGHAESLTGMSRDLKSVRPAIYVRR